MSSIKDLVLKQMPVSPLPPHEAFFSDQIIIFRPEILIAQEGSFSCYEFVIPSGYFPLTRVDQKEYAHVPNAVFPINPGQLHTTGLDHHVPFYYAAFIDYDFLNNTARQVFGSGEMYFRNASFPLNQTVYQLFYLFFQESMYRQPGYKLALQNLDLLLVMHLLRLTENSNSNRKLVRPPASCSKRIARCIDYLAENYRENISLEQLTELTGYSPYHLIRTFKAVTGMTPFAFLMDIKINKAKEMLQASNISVTEVCYRCGFNNQSYFTTFFKRKVGLSPTEYRKQAGCVF